MSLGYHEFAREVQIALYKLLSNRKTKQAIITLYIVNISKNKRLTTLMCSVAFFHPYPRWDMSPTRGTP